MAFNIKSTNEERIEAFALYQKAFNARKLSESTPPDGHDIHIMMEINGIGILLGPGSAVGKGLDNAIICEMRFDNENDFRKAYDVLTQEGQDYSLEGPYPWATLLALVTDKFGIGWALYFNES
ncbi:MAG: VOC family protein [Anaerolineae bacterium]